MQIMQMSKKIGSYIAVLAILTTNLYSQELMPLEPTEPTPAIDPARFMTHAEFVLMQEKRAEEDQNGSDDSHKPVPGQDASVVTEDGQGDKETATSGAYVALLYPGFCQLPIWFAADNTALQLMDGSIWQVAYGDTQKVKEWKYDQYLYITPNRWYFSSFSYEIVNMSNGETAEVNFLKQSFINDHVVKAINYDDNRIAINEGFDVAGAPVYSYWNITSSDHWLINKWLPEDKIIVGVNVGFTAYSYPYILINLYTGGYARASYHYTGY